jgi:hypothetical protein
MRNFKIRILPQNIIKLIKSRQIRAEGKAACRGKMRNAYELLAENTEKRDYLRELKIGVKITLQQILEMKCVDWIFITL